MSIQKVIPK